MSQMVAASSESRRYSAPGKVFVLGEYLALFGGPSLLLAVPPRFELILSHRVDFPSSPHPESPLGRLVGVIQKRKIRENPTRGSTFFDPWEGRGGFGASTAEFLLFYQWSVQRGDLPASEDPFAVWKLYRELCSSSASSSLGLTPSGADLVIQSCGGFGQFEFKGFTHPVFKDLNGALGDLDFAVLSATAKPGRKVATHSHLGSLEKSDFVSEDSKQIEELRKISQAACASAAQRDALSLGQKMQEYAEVLSAAGLEIPDSKSERLRLSKIPGVAGVKGAGALLSDALVVLLAPGSVEQRAEVRRLIEAEGSSLGLKLLPGSGGYVPGWRSDPDPESDL